MSTLQQNKSTKYLAIGHFPKPLTVEQFQTFMPKEVPATLQLYLDGKMEQFWLREDGNGVVFVMTTSTAEEAASLLKALPLGNADLLVFDLIAIGPLTPLGALIKGEVSPAA
jgi:hypothetical protein